MDESLYLYLLVITMTLMTFFGTHMLLHVCWKGKSWKFPSCPGSYRWAIILKNSLKKKVARRLAGEKNMHQNNSYYCQINIVAFWLSIQSLSTLSSISSS